MKTPFASQKSIFIFIEFVCGHVIRFPICKNVQLCIPPCAFFVIFTCCVISVHSHQLVIYYLFTVVAHVRTWETICLFTIICLEMYVKSKF